MSTFVVERGGPGSRKSEVAAYASGSGVLLENGTVWPTARESLQWTGGPGKVPGGGSQ
jgi:hypothetical protein